MNYYPFHIGDYASATRHLSWDEDMAYRRLMDAYYTREAPIPSDRRQAYRLACANTPEQREAIDVVLAEFFEETPEGWRNSRCDAELDAFQTKSAKASQSAQARWRNANGERTQSEGNANASDEACERIETECEGNAPKTNTKTNTNISEPRGSDKKPGKRALIPKPDSVSDAVWADFLAIRKAKRSPLTATALDIIEREAGKAGMTLAGALAVCCARGWQGFNADWVLEQARAAPAGSRIQRKPTLSEQNDAAFAEAERMIFGEQRP